MDSNHNEEVDTEAGLTDLEQRTQLHLRAWAKSQELDYDTLTEDEWLEHVR